MYLEIALKKLIDALVADFSGSFPRHDTEQFRNDCLSTYYTLLRGYTRHTLAFRMDSSDHAIGKISESFKQKFCTAKQPDLHYHINEVRTWLIMFGMLVLDDTTDIEKLQLNTAAYLSFYIGEYAEHAQVESIKKAYQQMLTEGLNASMLDQLPDEPTKPTDVN